MDHKNRISVFDFIWVLIAAIVFSLRYIKIINVDFGVFGSTYITFVQKISDCSLPVLNALNTCQNVSIVNIVWWLIIAVLVIIQLIVLANKLRH
jgi:hypothetical protein